MLKFLCVVILCFVVVILPTLFILLWITFEKVGQDDYNYFAKTYTFKTAWRETWRKAFGLPY